MGLQLQHFEYSQYRKPNLPNTGQRRLFSGGNSILMETSDNHVNGEQDITVPTPTSKKDKITILLYTKYYGKKLTEPVEIITAQQCNHLKNSFSTYKTFKSTMFSIPCKITTNKKYFTDSDAIVFHSRDLLGTELPKGRRNEKQLWVYMQQESQLHTFADLKEYSNVFNWTMTYRRDSDVYQPYGYLVPRSLDENSPASDFLPSNLTNKTGLVAWIVSNCEVPSKREILVRELQKYITVDVFGGCGENSCQSADCYEYIGSTYKMYLSFENSLCNDYITEKFYKALQYNMLPIVYGGGGTGQDYLEVAPKDSYIDARSFSDTKHLANYLLHLNNNDSDFLRYFEWKKKYDIVPIVTIEKTNDHNRWCSLCQRLYEHVNKFPAQVKWYKDLWSWWNYADERIKLKAGENQCASPLSSHTKAKVPRISLNMFIPFWFLLAILFFLILIAFLPCYYNLY